MLKLEYSIMKESAKACSKIRWVGVIYIESYYSYIPTTHMAGGDNRNEDTTLHFSSKYDHLQPFSSKIKGKAKEAFTVIIE